MARRFPLTAIGSILLTILLLAALPVSAQDIFVTPVPGVPFRAVVNVERSRTQSDGSVIILTTVRNIGRDNLGRIHNEARELLPKASTQDRQLIRVHLYDPQSRISTMLNPRDHTFWTRIVNHPPSVLPPALLNATPSGSSLPRNEFTNEEDLGIRDIEGLPAHGVRESQNIAANAGKQVIVTDEYWYSDDLRINLMIEHSDPRKDSVIMKVSQISRTEPDPAFFSIPEGYKPASFKK